MKSIASPARLGALAFAVVLAGCASTQGIESEASLRTPQSLGIPAAGTAPDARVAADWWQAYGDPQLDRLVTQALEGHPSLRVAQARLRRAQAATDVARAAGGPQVTGSFEAMRQRYSGNGLFPPPLAGSVRDSGTLQLGGSWELDFFGKHEAALQAALGAARAAEADVAAARVLLATNMVRSYLQLARANDQIAVAQRTLAQREEQLKLVRDRVRVGLDTQLEQRQGEGALPEARQQIEALQEQAQVARHAIAALAGTGLNDPVTASPSLARLPSLPVPDAIPADLLGGRADVAAARWRVEAATQDVKAARADFYPNVNLAGFVGLNALGLGHLLNAGSLQWGIGPAVHLPIFDAGRLRANLRGRTADLDAAVESYNGALLEGVRDVADQVAARQSVARQLAEQRQALAAAEGAWDIAVQRYRAGLGTYLNVLSAETAVLAQRRLGVDLQARARDAEVGLVRALGGAPAAAAPNTNTTTNTAAAR